MTDRRSFLASVGAGLVAGRALPLLQGIDGRAQFSAWTWVHGGGAVGLAGWRTRYARLRAAGISGVLVGGGSLAMHAEAAHAEGMVLHAWTWTMNRSGDKAVKEAHPAWFSVSREGKSSLTSPPYVGYYQWLCPTRPPVREYLAGVIDRIAATPGVDAVHLDYIRHPDVILPRNLWEQYKLVQDHEMPPYDFCYCEACRAGFRAAHGEDPATLADAATNAVWERYRLDRLTEVVAHIRGWTGCRTLSAAVFPTPALARRNVRQDWSAWPLDAVMPMIYHRGYARPLAWIEAAAREGVDALAGRIPLYAGLLLSSFPTRELPAAIRAATAGGAAGVTLFNLAAKHYPQLPGG